MMGDGFQRREWMFLPMIGPLLLSVASIPNAASFLLRVEEAAGLAAAVLMGGEAVVGRGVDRIRFGGLQPGHEELRLRLVARTLLSAAHTW